MNEWSLVAYYLYLPYKHKEQRDSKEQKIVTL